MTIDQFRILSAAAILAAAFGFGCEKHEEVSLSSSEPSVPMVSDISEASSSLRLPINARMFLDEDRFRAVWAGAPSQARVPGTVVAGVVNHHALASDLLADFFQQLKLARPTLTRIILLSPDHYHVGHAAISTHQRTYTTPDGDVSIDTAFVRTLEEMNIAMDESSGTMFEKEHGVGTLVPFLRHEFSEVKLVPITIRGSIPRPEAVALGTRLAELIDDETMIIVSADMSHYLSEPIALEHDERTLKALSSLDSTFLGRVNDDFTDNGASFVVLQSFFEAKGMIPTFTLFDHSISTRYGGPFDNTTSYLTGVWSVR